jgi:NADH:ubiquinone oxidoreductase subunit E
MAETAELIRNIVKRYDGTANKDAIIAILNDVQEELGYVPYEAQRLIALETDIPLAEIYGIVTFYSRFSLKPVGKYKISVCMGTACYVKGAHKILEQIEHYCGIKAGETTEDGFYSIVTTRCLGACGFAPIMTVNGQVHGKLHPDDIVRILEQYK